MTQELLKEIFDYDEATGIFIHKINKGRLAKKGDIAGHVNKRGYVVIKAFSKAYKAHRLAWLWIHGEMPKQIDHINGIKHDNRISNLRNVGDYEQCRNKPIPKNNTSGILGVYYCKTMKKWTAHIGYDNKTKTLGRFNTKEEAITARKKAEEEQNYHKNHGRLA